MFIIAKFLHHTDSMTLIEKLRNLIGVEEVKTQIVLDRIKEDTRIIDLSLFLKNILLTSNRVIYHF